MDSVMQLPALVGGRLKRLCADVGSPLSAEVLHHLEANEWEALLRIEVDPGDYTAERYGSESSAVEAYRADAGLVALFSKNASITIVGQSPREAALKKWYLSEELCTSTNARFSNYNAGFFPDCDWRVVEFIHRVQRRVARILGPCPKRLAAPRMGPGTTFEASELFGDACRSLTAADKMTLSSLTSDARVVALHNGTADRFTDPQFTGEGVPHRVVRGNRWDSVPKNALTDRSIGLEPGVNVYLQLGVAAEMQLPLARCGVDLACQQRRHRDLARDALRLGLATLDESMASDLWATQAVKFLLAQAGHWYDLLDSIRSRFTLVNGKWVRLEKFSSMGNGFTFPLQTILFYAITREIVGEEGVVSVFGDDIICPSDRALDVLAALRFFGHKPNIAKTHFDGSFRESCGEDYLYGRPVRPHFLKEWPCSPRDWIALHNGLVRRSSSRGHLAFAAWCKRQIPLEYRFGGPESLGDAVLHGHRWRCRVRNGIRQVRGVKDIGKLLPIKHLDSQGLLLALLSNHARLTYSTVKLPNGRKVTKAYMSYRGTGGWKKGWFVA